MGVHRGRQFRDHAVLYRTNAQSNALEYAMKRNGIAYRIVGGTKSVSYTHLAGPGGAAGEKGKAEDQAQQGGGETFHRGGSFEFENHSHAV